MGLMRGFGSKAGGLWSEGGSEDDVVDLVRFPDPQGAVDVELGYVFIGAAL